MDIDYDERDYDNDFESNENDDSLDVLENYHNIKKYLEHDCSNVFFLSNMTVERFTDFYKNPHLYTDNDNVSISNVVFVNENYGLITGTLKICKSYIKNLQKEDWYNFCFRNSQLDLWINYKNL